jgi:hypothetical protein
MACDDNTNKACSGAAASGGISKTQSKTTFVSASFANKALDVIDRNGLVARVARNPLTKVAISPYTVTALTAQAPVLLGRAAIDTVASTAVGKRPFGSGIRPDVERGAIEHVIIPQTYYDPKGVPFKRSTPISIYHDKKDPSITCFQMEEGLWEKKPYRGGTLLEAKMQPSRRIYFKGDISNDDAVHVAAGIRKAHKLGGYVGQVSELEMLSPAWAITKQKMIQACFEEN